MTLDNGLETLYHFHQYVNNPCRILDVLTYNREEVYQQLYDSPNVICNTTYVVSY